MIARPDIAAPLVSWLLLAPIVIAGFFVVGHLTFRRLASPLPWLTASIGSLLVLFFGVQILDLVRVPITFASLGGTLGLASIIGALLGGRRSILGWPIPRPRTWWREWWWLASVGIAVGSVLVRGVLQPLAGFDNFFRWDYLAQLMHAQGSLAHYPPVTAADFRVYPWCDGIPPLIPVCNLWIYLGTGSTYGGLIVGRVAVELALTLGLVWHLARAWWGGSGARIAVLALATSSVFLWSAGMEQETGLSGVTLLAITALVLAYHQRSSSSTAIWVGLTAGLSALCRDYNLLFVPMALLALGLAKATRRDLLLALGAATLTALPWYLRNAWLTANPLFPQDLGGLFPSNFVYVETMRAIRDHWALTSPHAQYRMLGLALVIGLGMLSALAIPGLCSTQVKPRTLHILLLANVALWIASISSTAGGWVYSLRVLGTGLPLLAVAAGWWGARLQGRTLRLAALGLVPFCLDAARRSWIFAWLPFAQPWPYTWTPWTEVHRYISASRHSTVWPSLAEAAGPGAIVVDSPNYFVLGGRAGGIMISLFSPEAAVLTATPPDKDLSALVRALQRQGIRFVILTDDGSHNRNFLLAQRGLRLLFDAKPTLETEGMRIYDLALMARASP